MHKTVSTQHLQDIHTLNGRLARAEQHTEIQTALQNFFAFWPDIEYVFLVTLDEAKDSHSIWRGIPEHLQTSLSPFLGWVQKREQQSIFLPDLQKASLPEDLRGALLVAGLRSLGLLPLSNGDVCLGYLLLGSASIHPLDDADWGWVQLAADAVGPVLRCQRHTEEIAAHEATEGALRASETRYRELYENAPNAYFSVGNDGIIYRVNRQAEQFTGYTAAELIGRPVLEIHVDTPEDDSAQATFAEFTSGAEIREREIRLRRADGSIVWIALTVTPIRNAAGAIVASRSVAVDISERRALQEMRQAFVDMIVHDLRHPLGVIAASADMLDFAIDAENEDDRQFLDFIREGTKQAIALTENILDTHRLEQKQMPVAIQSVSASAVIQNVAQEFSVHLAQYNLALTLRLTPELPSVQGDPQLLKRVLQNLLHNAIKFTPAGRSIVRVAQPHEEAGVGGVQIAVADNGPGISEEVRARLFHLFATGTGSRSGFGVGLTFCKLAMEAMGGRIRLESRPGQGSTFLIFLPAATLF